MQSIYEKYPPGHVERIFQWHFNQSKDASGNTSIIIKKVEEQKRKNLN